MTDSNYISYGIQAGFIVLLVICSYLLKKFLPSEVADKIEEQIVSIREVPQYMKDEIKEEEPLNQ